MLLLLCDVEVIKITSNCATNSSLALLWHESLIYIYAI
jgi:hypothetical protein